VTKPRLRPVVLTSVFLAALVVPVVSSAPARARIAAQSQTSTPSASPTTSVEVRAGNAVLGLLILTGFAAAGYYVSKLIRGRKRPRPPGPWFGGGRR